MGKRKYIFAVNLAENYFFAEFHEYFILMFSLYFVSNYYQRIFL